MIKPEPDDHEQRTQQISTGELEDRVAIQADTIVPTTATRRRKKRTEQGNDDKAYHHAILNQQKKPRAQSFYKEPHSEKSRLPENFQPGPFDVICARGKEARNHIGNKKFRTKIAEVAAEYARAGNRMSKSLAVSSIVDWVREKTGPNGGFVKLINGVWYEVGDHLAREKVGQALREHNHQLYRSSTKAKRRRWEQEKHSASTSNSEDELEKTVRADPFIARTINFMERRRLEMGGDHAPEAQLMDLFFQSNCLILSRLHRITTQDSPTRNTRVNNIYQVT